MATTPPTEEHPPAAYYMSQQPTQGAADELWGWVIKGLVVLLGATLIGTLVMLAMGKNIDVLVTIFTASLTGLLGIFAPSPNQG
jgi:hypothetical protein